MGYRYFEEIIANTNLSSRKVIAVVGAHDRHTIEAIARAKRRGIGKFILIGNKIKIEELLIFVDEDSNNFRIIHELDEITMAKIAVKLVKDRVANYIMKGLIQTKNLLMPVVDSEDGIKQEGRIMSHVAILEVPSYKKLLAVSDGGMIIDPDLEEKQKIMENVVEVFHMLGYDKPKVGALTALEQVSEKMSDTIEARKLQEIGCRGAIVEGPISLDVAISERVATTKGYKGEIPGDVDILLVPNISTGNALAKSMVHLGGGRMAGFIVGARVPIIMTSRGATSEEKYLSIVVVNALEGVKGGNISS